MSRSTSITRTTRASLTTSANCWWKWPTAKSGQPSTSPSATRIAQAQLEPSALRRRTRRKVALLQQHAVMQLMPGNNVSQRAHGDRIVVGRARTRPGVFRQVLKESSCGCARGLEFGQHTVQRPLVEATLIDVHILIETRERSLVATGDAQGA